MDEDQKNQNSEEEQLEDNKPAEPAEPPKPRRVLAKIKRMVEETAVILLDKKGKFEEIESIYEEHDYSEVEIQTFLKIYSLHQ